jgi:lipid-A-disaccharide synthase-like uncharacterized protein
MRLLNRPLVALCLLAAGGLAAVACRGAGGEEPATGTESEAVPAPSSAGGTVAGVKVQLAGADERVRLRQLPDGSLRFLVERHDGAVEPLNPDQFARRVFDEEARRHWWLLVLNITSPLGLAWVGVGLGGQLLFTGRMLLQWVASERSRRSVVPAGFWWLSLVGASMLVVYFVWRKDAVGVLGQATGWIVYLRNLTLIYRGRREATPAGAA